MKVRDILCRLQEADPEAVVLYLAPYADADDGEAEEICDVVLVPDAWRCERHRCGDGCFSHIHHPATGGLSLGWDQNTDEQWLEQVVILSSVQRGQHG
ncbi:hypothetical protein OKW43_005807 [Paraburkholderia sp. WC7.3g]|uniref:Uncharacterized protein n=1 Tax=Paraburkholderia podalyriae TaxID=1938811 RepID=A0ABR7PV68_9BURK|nr:hypothetical protein [Paraburkholderia podalyriae]MBC8750182.1 hypothetical protein [Paraburkholderia podalyriae]